MDKELVKNLDKLRLYIELLTKAHGNTITWIEIECTLDTNVYFLWDYIPNISVYLKPTVKGMSTEQYKTTGKERGFLPGDTVLFTPFESPLEIERQTAISKIIESLDERDRDKYGCLLKGA